MKQNRINVDVIEDVIIGEGIGGATSLRQAGKSCAILGSGLPGRCVGVGPDLLLRS
jgi:hypothetical protein